MKRSLVLLALPLALVVAACGGSDTLSLDAVAQAADKTAAQKSARFEMSMGLTMPGVADPVRMTASGAIDYAAKRMRMDMDMTEVARASGGAGAPGELKMSMVMDGNAMYMKLPQAARAQGGPPTPWVKVDLERATGVDLARMNQWSQNPAEQLELLRAVSDRVEKRGTREIRGVETTHFHAVVDMQKALAEGMKDIPREQRAKVRRAVRTLAAQSGMKQLPMDVYLDEDGVLRRMAMDMRMKVPGQQGTMRMQMTMDLFDFGAKVDVAPPAADQVTDVTEQVLAQQGKRTT